MVNKLRVAIVSAVWKRPEVFEMFAKGIHALTAHPYLEIDYDVIITGSEGLLSKTMVENHGFTYIEIPNAPLATKVNAPVLIAKQLNVDYILCLGSDDIITPELMAIYESYMKQSIDYIAVNDFYFYDTESKKAAYWGGYRESWRKGHACGAGRLISKRLLDTWNWQPWDVKHNLILDNSIQDKLKSTPHTEAIFSLKEKNVFALDIKSSTNMTPFQLWDNTNYIDTEIIKTHFPYIF